MKETENFPLPPSHYILVTVQDPSYGRSRRIREGRKFIDLQGRQYKPLFSYFGNQRKINSRTHSITLHTIPEKELNGRKSLLTKHLPRLK